jgi:hypothetical protein
MAITYEIISSVTVGAGGAANMSFTSIPQTYTDLLIVLSGRTSYTTFDSILVTFNGSTSNFSGIVGYGDGSGTAVFSAGRWAGSQPGTGTAQNFANNQLYIANYASSSNKAFLTDSTTETNGNPAYTYIGGSLWSNTSAITSITLTPNAGNFVQYSTATLYGIKNS